MGLGSAPPVRLWRTYTPPPYIVHMPSTSKKTDLDGVSKLLDKVVELSLELGTVKAEMASLVGTVNTIRLEWQDRIDIMNRLVNRLDKRLYRERKAAEPEPEEEPEPELSDIERRISARQGNGIPASIGHDSRTGTG